MSKVLLDQKPVGTDHAPGSVRGLGWEMAPAKAKAKAKGSGWEMAKAQAPDLQKATYWDSQDQTLATPLG
jgi:hypothetical protein